MTDWTALQHELDAWIAAGRTAAFWWRDDDAVEPTPALERLLGLVATHAVPLALAVVPARTGMPLARRLAAAEGDIVPVQHGFAHRNHAAPAVKKAELGPQRPAAVVLEELARGRARMAALFGARVGAMLVPPWNRIDEALLPALPSLGFSLLSTYGARPAAEAAPGLVCVNTHLDLIRWKEPRGFAGERAAFNAVLEHLQARRSGAADAAEPTGILTHHLAHDTAAWAFLDRLLRALRAHPAVRFVAVTDAVAAAPARPRREVA